MPAAAAMPGVQRQHIAALDGVRAIAVLTVFLFHVSRSVVIVTPVAERAPIDDFMFKVFAPGWIGVDLFFVLSGFLITGILLDAKHGSGYFRTFYARRVLRIFPLYYAFLLFVILLPQWRDALYVLGWENVATYQWWFWTYTSNLPLAFPRAFDTPGFPSTHLWTLAIEEQFYLVWPLVVFLVSRRWLPAVCLLFMAVALGFRVLVNTDVANSWGSFTATYYFTISKLDPLAMGALIACLLAVPGGAIQWRRWFWASGGAGFAVLLYLFVKYQGFPAAESDVNTIGYTALALFFGAFVFLAASASPTSTVARWLSGATITSVGVYAYAIYLFHPIVLGELLSGVMPAGGMIPHWFGAFTPFMIVYTIIAFWMTYGLAWLSWRFFEGPILKLKRFVPYGPPAAAPAPQPASVLPAAAPASDA